ncbi:MAG TPA: hypothetical protein VII83_08425 [Gaiellaceae bacterium]
MSSSLGATLSELLFLNDGLMRPFFRLLPRFHNEALPLLIVRLFFRLDEIAETL